MNESARSNFQWWRLLAVAVAIALPIVWRLVRQDLGAPANLELLTAASFFAAGILPSRWAALSSLAMVAISDVVLGNTAILWWTWSAWAVIGLGSLLTRRLAAGGGWRRYVAALGFGLGGTAFFYLWTNFGVWAGGWGIPFRGGLPGLLQTYVAGIPFVRTQLLGNLVLVPVAAAVLHLVERLGNVPAENAALTSA